MLPTFKLLILLKFILLFITIHLSPYTYAAFSTQNLSEYTNSIDKYLNELNQEKYLIFEEVRKLDKTYMDNYSVKESPLISPSKIKTTKDLYNNYIILLQRIDKLTSKIESQNPEIIREINSLKKDGAQLTASEFAVMSNRLAGFQGSKYQLKAVRDQSLLKYNHLYDLLNGISLKIKDLKFSKDTFLSDRKAGGQQCSLAGLKLNKSPFTINTNNVTGLPQILNADVYITYDNQHDPVKNINIVTPIVSIVSMFKPDTDQIRQDIITNFPKNSCDVEYSVGNKTHAKLTHYTGRVEMPQLNFETESNIKVRKCFDIDWLCFKNFSMKTCTKTIKTDFIKLNNFIQTNVHLDNNSGKLKVDLRTKITGKSRGITYLNNTTSSEIAIPSIQSQFLKYSPLSEEGTLTPLNSFIYSSDKSDTFALVLNYTMKNRRTGSACYLNNEIIESQK